MSSDNHGRRQRQQQAEDNAFILSAMVMVSCFLTGFVVDLLSDVANNYVSPMAAIFLGLAAAVFVARWYLHHHAPRQ